MLLGNPHLDEVFFTDPLRKRKWILKDNNLLVRGTPGSGDFMFTLCTGFYIANLLNTKIHITFHWKHGEDFVYHFEDPETIFEKIDYFFSLCYNNHNVTYSHEYNSTMDFKGEMLLNLSIPNKRPKQTTMPMGLNSWKFKDHIMNRETIYRKVVVWRFKNNAESPSKWKRTYSDKYWDDVVDELQDQGWSVTEICYRTPIRSVLYHLQTCELAMGYDGMWHYVARMLYKPTIITGDNNIIASHNPQAVHFYNPSKDMKKGDDLMSFVKKFDKTYIECQHRARHYARNLDAIIEN